MLRIVDVRLGFVYIQVFYVEVWVLVLIHDWISTTNGCGPLQSWLGIGKLSLLRINPLPRLLVDFDDLLVGILPCKHHFFSLLFFNRHLSFVLFVFHFLYSIRIPQSIESMLAAL